MLLLHYQQHFGAMEKLHARNSQAETRNGIRDLFATQLTYICHLWVEQIFKKVWRPQWVSHGSLEGVLGITLLCLELFCLVSWSCCSCPVQDEQTLAPEASLALAPQLLSISPAALNSSRNCEVLQDVVARLSPVNHPLVQISAFPPDWCGCNVEVWGCHLQAFVRVCHTSVMGSYLLSLGWFPASTELIYGASPSCVGRWARAVVKNSFQAVKIILHSAEMDPHQLEPGTTRDLLRFQWGFSFLCSSLRLAQNRVCWKEEMTFQGPSHLGGDAEAT